VEIINKKIIILILLVLILLACIDALLLIRFDDKSEKDTRKEMNVYAAPESQPAKNIPSNTKTNDPVLANQRATIEATKIVTNATIPEANKSPVWTPVKAMTKEQYPDDEPEQNTQDSIIPLRDNPYIQVRNKVSIMGFEPNQNTKPERLVLSVGDTFNLQNGLKGELEAAAENRLLIMLFYEKNGRKIYFPQPFRFVPKVADSLGNAPFISVGGGYVYFVDYEEDGQKTTIDVFDSCIGIYERCMNDPAVDDAICEATACPYEPYREGLYRMDYGQFSIIYPEGLEIAALHSMKYLPRCYESAESAFAREQDINRFYMNMRENSQGLAHAKADIIFLSWQEYMEDNFLLENAGDSCGIGLFPLGHELVHVQDFGTLNTHLLREGLANYLSRRFESFDKELVCTTDGYYGHYHSTGQDEPIQHYPTNPEEFESDSYNAGECYFQLLEKRFGREKVDQVIQKLGETRNIPTIGDVNFILDIVEPILGTEATNLAESIGIDTRWTYGIPFRGSNHPEI
jgi:hypothetical protein